MKLLICTQALDRNHPILGFFHRWIEEFAKHCEEVHVICLIKGEYSLPSNVFVHSLGKEEGENKLKYLIRFYSYIWKLRNRYDKVFVHMNQVYVILGGFLWRLLGKKIGLWYAHGSVPLTLKIAEWFVTKIFTASEESCRLLSKKIKITGHGIDTEHFAPQVKSKDIDLVTVGRISRSKNIHTLIKILASINDRQKINLTLLGDTTSIKDEVYKKELLSLINNYNLVDNVDFRGSVLQSGLPDLLNRAKVFVHTAQNGSLDKAVLEAMSCEIPVVSTAEGSKSLPLGEWLVSDEKHLSEIIIKILNSDVSQQSKNLREYVKKQHSLTVLIPKLLSSFI